MPQALQWTASGVTAASIWNTGVSVAYGRIEIALVLSAVNFLSLLLLTPLAERWRDDADDGGSSA